jgi:hypothetical protein
VTAEPVLAYFGHHKCASSWVLSIVSEVCRDIGLPSHVVLDALTPQSTGPLTDFVATFERPQLRQRIDELGGGLVACVTADQAQAEVLQPAKAFHVIRDPRDIVVSAYFSHLYSHPTEGLQHLQRHREELQSLSPEEGLLSEFDFSATELDQLGEWDYCTDHILELKMEDLTADPYSSWLKIFRHLGLLSDVDPVRTGELVEVWVSRAMNRLSRRPRMSRVRRPIGATGEVVLGAAYKFRFDAQASGRDRGDEDVTSHYRKGVSGDWRNHFTPEHTRQFMERFGDVLSKLGYDSDD